MQQKQQKQKPVQDRPEFNPNPERCSFYLAQKRRFCSFEVIKGSKFCGQHQHLDENNATQNSKKKRVPCPLSNGAHYVPESELEKHLKVCPDGKFVAERLPYFSRSLHRNANLANIVSTSSSSSTSSSLNSNTVAVPVMKNENVTEISHKSLSPQELLETWQKLVHIFRTFVLPDLDLLDDSVLCGLHLVSQNQSRKERKEQQEEENSNNIIASTSGTGKIEGGARVGGKARVSQKHAPQHRGIVSCLEKINAIEQTDVFIELGAGSAELSLAVADEFASRASGTSSSATTTSASSASALLTTKVPPLFLVVDRGHIRRPADSRVARETTTTSATHQNQNQQVGSFYRPFQRCRIDIADFDLFKVPLAEDFLKQKQELQQQEQSSQPSLLRGCLIAKHLCGGGSDLCISCAVHSSSSSSCLSNSNNNSIRVDFVAVAPCCHHRCERELMMNLLDLAKLLYRNNNNKENNDNKIRFEKLQECISLLDDKKTFGPCASFSTWATAGHVRTKGGRRKRKGEALRRERENQNSSEEQEGDDHDNCDSENEHEDDEDDDDEHACEDEDEKEGESTEGKGDGGSLQNQQQPQQHESSMMMAVTDFVSGSALTSSVPQFPKDRERAGRMCKLIFDWIRATTLILSSRSLKHFALKPFLITGETKENWLILAW